MKRNLVMACAAVCALVLGCNRGGAETPQSAAPAAAATMTDEQKTLYALGQTIGGQIGVFNLNKAELQYVTKGLEDAVAHATPAVDMATFGPKVRQLAQDRVMKNSVAEKGRGQAFADKAVAEGGTKLPSGLVFKEISKGTGAAPKPTDVVRVHYKGTLIDGTEFDSSYKRGQPAEFGLNQVIPCWTEGVQKIGVGGKARLVCPSDIAYGDNGRPPTIPGGSTLVFEVELIGIGPAPPVKE